MSVCEPLRAAVSPLCRFWPWSGDVGRLLPVSTVSLSLCEAQPLFVVVAVVVSLLLLSLLLQRTVSLSLALALVRLLFSRYVLDPIHHHKHNKHRHAPLLPPFRPVSCPPRQITHGLVGRSRFLSDCAPRLFSSCACFVRCLPSSPDPIIFELKTFGRIKV